MTAVFSGQFEERLSIVSQDYPAIGFTDIESSDGIFIIIETLTVCELLRGDKQVFEICISSFCQHRRLMSVVYVIGKPNGLHCMIINN